MRWLFNELEAHDVDAVTLMWWMHRRVDQDRLPPGRVVVQFDFVGSERTTIWLVLEPGDVSVCLKHPGYDVDVIVTSSTGDLAEVFSGFETWRRAVSAGTIRVDGPPRLCRALPTWFEWSPFALAVQAETRTRRGGETSVAAAGS